MIETHESEALPDWLHATHAGLFCAPGGFFVDPSRPVERAIISHGHADHARTGHDAVLTTPATAEIMRARYGQNLDTTRIETLSYGACARVGDVDLRLAPAGHILGSAQIILEYRGTRVVVSGDYKRRPDPTCTPFEVVSCDILITEATFALPVFRHPEVEGEIHRLLRSLSLFSDRCHLVGVYALGKCQRLISLLRGAGYDRPIYLHGALVSLCHLYERHGVRLGRLIPVSDVDRATLAGEIVMCPPSALADRWSRAFPEPLNAMASGWMLIRQRARQRGVELPLVISDHADWDELTTTVQETGARHIFVTHGRDEALVHYARSLCLNAVALSLAGYEDDEA